MTNYFIANGMILNTGMSVEEIELSVQEKLDETTGGMAQFRLQELSNSGVTMVFIRDFLIDPYEPVIFDCDMNLILNIGIEAFLPKEVGGYPLVFPLNFAGKNFYTDMTAFIRLYKTLLLMYRKQEVEYIGIRCYSDRIVMKIEF
ncbi:hypothetical protein [Phocaeicola salanitronis]|uniref:hypothetical protein n=1 Tax=Phocaeicola salanitronis TaxID=376805 RepID=UPI0023F87126|nr:hypothetical protein [Phocaeicola salanitronis]